MCQVGKYTFEITIDVVNMVERRTTQSENVKELRFSKNVGWSQFAYLKLRKTRSGFSIPLDFEIAKVACMYIIMYINVFILCLLDIIRLYQRKQINFVIVCHWFSYQTQNKASFK